MDALSMLFGPGGSAMLFSFQIGYIPTEDDFLPMTEDQMAKYVKDCGETSETMYVFTPTDPTVDLKGFEGAIPCLSESEVKVFETVRELFNEYAVNANKTFDNDDELLQFMAHQLPDVFSKGTKYEMFHHMEVVKK